MITIDQVIESVYPRPVAGTDAFYDTWGYEQYLIRKTRHDLEQLRILLHPEYHRALLGEWLVDHPLTTWPALRLPIVRAARTMDVSVAFLGGRVCKDMPGVLLWPEGRDDDALMTDNGTVMCLFPSSRPGAAYGFISPMRFDYIHTGLFFEDEAQVLELIPHDRVMWVSHINPNYVMIPQAEGVWYGKKAYYNTAELQQAAQRKNGKWYVPKGTPIRRLVFTPEQMDEVRVIQRG